MKKRFSLGLVLVLCPWAFGESAFTPNETMFAHTYSCAKSQQLWAQETIGSFELLAESGYLILRTYEPVSHRSKMMRPLFILADHAQIYTVSVPPLSNPWKDLHFQLRIPTTSGQKNYCVHSKADGVLNDKIVEFEIAPLGGCTGGTLTATVVRTRDAERRWHQLQTALARGLMTSAKIFEYVNSNLVIASAPSSRLDRKLANLDLASCDKLDHQFANKDLSAALKIVQPLTTEPSESLGLHKQQNIRSPASAKTPKINK